MSIRVRIAPSPSGHLHVGTARTAVHNYLFARHHDGEFVLRIEDTDEARSSSEYVEVILESLKWLGLDWDGDVLFQSTRFDEYRSEAERMLAEGAGYRCFCTPEELEQRRKQAIAEKRPPRYDGRCREIPVDESERRAASGEKFAIRVALPTGGETRFDDIVYGEQVRANVDLDDFVCLRADGRATYNFACVVDDNHQRISHVVRGNDHITNTFKQINLYRALGYDAPRFAHLPLILAPDRSKLSKRKGAVSVTDYRERGIVPQAFVNYLALLGWSPGDDREVFGTLDELADAFTLERVGTANPIFDFDKLVWLSGQHLSAWPPEKVLDEASPFLERAGVTSPTELDDKREWAIGVFSLLAPRMRTLADAVSLGSYFFVEPDAYDEKGDRKQFGSREVSDRMSALADAWEHSEWNATTLEKALRAVANELGLKAKDLIHPARLAVTGIAVGPGIFELAEYVGAKQTIDRLRRAAVYIRDKFIGE